MQMNRDFRGLDWPNILEHKPALPHKRKSHMGRAQENTVERGFYHRFWRKSSFFSRWLTGLDAFLKTEEVLVV